MFIIVQIHIFFLLHLLFHRCFLVSSERKGFIIFAAVLIHTPSKMHSTLGYLHWFSIHLVLPSFYYLHLLSYVSLVRCVIDSAMDVYGLCLHLFHQSRSVKFVRIQVFNYVLSSLPYYLPFPPWRASSTWPDISSVLVNRQSWLVGHILLLSIGSLNWVALHTSYVAVCV